MGNKEMIVHPGYDSKEYITSEETIKSFSILKDNDYNIIIENMPKIGISKDTFLFGTTRQELQEVISEIDCKFCLDFGHAICSSNYHKINYMEFITDLMKLDPFMFHISDGYLNSLEDNHLSFTEGDFPIKELVNLVDNKFITLETPKKNDFMGLSEDLKNINILTH
nr:TIM barrel protein [Methanococcus voltae]